MAPTGPNAIRALSKVRPQSKVRRSWMQKPFGWIPKACRILRPPAQPRERRERYRACLRSAFTQWRRSAEATVWRTQGGAEKSSQSYPAWLQYVEHTEGDGAEMFAAVCKLGLEGIVSKRIGAPYRSGPTKTWLKIKNPKSPAATRAADGTF